MFRQGRHLLGIGAVLAGCGGTTVVYVFADGGAGKPTDGGDATATVTMPASVPEACQALCTRLARDGCIKANCTGDCQTALVSDKCSDPYVKFLTCALEPDFACDNGVAMLSNHACLDEKNAFYQCRAGQTIPDVPVVQDAMTPVPEPMDMDDAAPEPVDSGKPTACPSIPPLPDTATCDGADPDAGLNDAEVYPMCARNCGDGVHKWRAECADGKCRCAFDEKEVCTCPQAQYACNVDCCF